MTSDPHEIRRQEESQAARVDEICDAFEAAWLADDQPRIEAYLENAEPPLRGDLLRELVLAELNLRIRAGERPDRTEYVGRFPDVAGAIDEFLQHQDGRGVLADRTVSQPPTGTKRTDDTATPGELQIRCPHCNTPAAVDADSPFTDIACSSCGSHFSLASDESETRAASSVTAVGHFRLIERLGLGGFGTVWKARDTELDRTVAVKIPRKGQLAPHEVEQFLREARAAAQLKHPNIVAIHEVGRDDETIYIVSDLVRGVSLSDWLTGQRPTVRRAAELCRVIAEALDHAHELGVIHRDLKPQNILMDGADQPHLMDFGLARRVAADVTMTVEGQLLGTPAYMSPEQARGEAHQADRRTDVYSLGVILFELLTGELPFRGNARIMIHQVMYDEPPSPRKFDGRVPRDLETVCLKCLEKEPRKRFGSAGEVADELARFLSGEPIHARPISMPARAWRRCKRNPVISALAAGLVVALLAGLIGVSWQWMRAEGHAANERAARLDADREAARANRNAAEEAKARRMTRRLLYVADMNVAQEAWQANNVARVVALLERHQPKEGEKDLRGFQWYYLWGLCQRGRQTLTLSYSAPISAVAFSPDGKTLAASGYDYRVELWDTDTGQRKTTLRSAAKRIPFVSFSPDGGTLAMADHKWGGWVNLVDAVTGEGDKLTHYGTVFAVAYSPDGELLAAAPLLKPISLWNLATGEHRELGTEDVVYSLVFSPDGKMLASGSQDSTVKLWNVESGSERATLSGHTNQVRCVEFSHDGKTLASASFDKTVKLWDITNVQNPVPKATLEAHTGQVWCVAFAPDGVLASGSADNTVKIWDPDRQIQKDTLKGHGKVVSALAFSSDGKTLASASFDGSVKLWDMDDTMPQDTLRGHTAPVRSVAITPDGKHVVSGSDDYTARVWDLETGLHQRTLEGHDGWINALAISPDGKTLATAGEDNQLRVWDLATGHQRADKKGSKGRGVRAVAFSPDSRTLVTGDDHFWVRLWDADSADVLSELIGHSFWVNAVVYSPDGRTVASASYDKTVRVWDMETRKERFSLPGHDGFVTSVAFSPDGTTLASGSFDNTVRLWAIESGEEKRILSGHAGSVVSVAYSPDGRILASGSSDNTIKLWYLATDKEPETLTGHTSDVSSLAFSPDGNTLVSGSLDATVRIWRRATVEEVRVAGE